MGRIFVVITFLVGSLALLISQSAAAFTVDTKQYVNAENTFYAYVRGGESIDASFIRANLDAVSGSKQPVTITIEGPDAKQQKCTITINTKVNQGCSFKPQVATKSGIWRMQLITPSDARLYPEVHPTVKWGRYALTWTINVKSSKGVEQHGRIWTNRYAMYQTSAHSSMGDFTNYYVSEDGYVYRATELGYNGVASVLSADGIGIRKGQDCTSVYRSTQISDTDYSPALGQCGDIFKLFFEEPSGDLPDKAATWDGSSDWILPNIGSPEISELHFEPDSATDQQSGVVSFFLHGFIGQYQIKVDVENDGSFDGQNDVTINRVVRDMKDGLQHVSFDGVDRQGQIIPRGRKIGIKVVITKAAEIHFVAADVEGRTGGIEVTRLNGDNAPTTGLCWDDTQLLPITSEALMTSTVDGRDCPSSKGGIHGWGFGSSSWGDKRFIDDWSYATAKLSGSNQIVYPTDAAATEDTGKSVPMGAILAALGAILLISGIVVGIMMKFKSPKKPAAVPTSSVPSQPPVNPGYQQPPANTPPVIPPANNNDDRF